jgi:hypothetical protein
MKMRSEEPLPRLKPLSRKLVVKRRYRVHRTFQLYLHDTVTVSAISPQDAEKLVYRASTAQSVYDSLKAPRVKSSPPELPSIRYFSNRAELRY